MLILTFNKFKCLKKKRPFGPSILHLIDSATNKLFYIAARSAMRSAGCHFG